MLARWRSKPIKYRVRERQPITERHQSISLKSRQLLTILLTKVVVGQDAFIIYQWPIKTFSYIFVNVKI